MGITAVTRNVETVFGNFVTAILTVRHAVAVHGRMRQTFSFYCFNNTRTVFIAAVKCHVSREGGIGAN